jgi:hypothetical protein
MSKSKGGFPPINYCQEDLKKIMSNSDFKPIKTQDNIDSTKQRLFAPNNPINVRQILKDSINKPILKTDIIKDEDLIIVDSF